MSHSHAALGGKGPAVAHGGGLHTVAPATDHAEHEADRFADSFVATRFSPVWSFGDLPVHAGDDAALGPGLEGPLSAGLGADLSDVRLHDGPAAADLAERAGADAVTIGHEVSFAPGKRDARTRDGVRRIAHEVAHTVMHSDKNSDKDGDKRVAHRDGQAAVTPATTLAGLPEADRKAIQVVTTMPVSVTGLTEKFETKGGKMTLGLPSDTTVVADTSAAKVQQHGLRNVGAALVTEADVSPAPLPPNSTVTLELDLSTYGGIKGLYRFTYHAPPTSKGKAAAKRVIIEQLGTGTIPAGQKPPTAEGEKVKDPVAAKLTAASITHSYSADKLEALRAAISEIPDAHLAKVSGLKFKTASSHPTRPDVAGHYDPTTHTVTMFAKAFDTAQNKYEQGKVATSFASRAIIHEIGHAIDLAPLRKASANYKSGAKGAEQKLKDARSESGTKVAKKDGVYEDVIGTAAKGVAFREAVKKDGKNISKYAEEDWQESYAEAYSLYIASSDNLQLLRPATYAYFLKAMPK